jgi:hypothetical protein
MSISRRGFLAVPPLAGLLIPSSAVAQAGGGGGGVAPPAPHDAFPFHERGTVREIVVAAHSNVVRVRELLSNRPALANAGWDWGFGDWETPLAAAAHMGNKEIAGILLAAGARPTLFSAAMLGQLSVVRSYVEASPGIQRVRGAHGITLLQHARAGGAAEVLAYLASIEGANEPYRNEPLDATARASCIGEYAFGPAPDQRLVVTGSNGGGLNLKRAGDSDRALLHQGRLVFHPPGAEAVRIQFAPGSPSSSVTITDGPVVVVARRA